MQKKFLKTDLAIAQAANCQPLEQVIKEFHLTKNDLIPYGRHIAKIDLDIIEKLKDRPNAKYIDVTSMSPTPLGAGKTTTTVGLGMALNKIGQKAVITIRQPSMGPTFGIKGGAAGGGYSQIIPMEEFNLHLTGDIHAITVAHNLIAATLDNHLAHGNKLAIVPETITWGRVIDISDRPLRKARIGIGGGKEFGYERNTFWDITVASEIMAILALTTSLADLRERIGNIIVALDKNGKPITTEDLRVAGAATVLMKDTLLPNLLQTLDHTPVLVHAGPFANIAPGNSSILADLIGIKMGDYLVTESGFGADIGMEKFMNIKCRYSGLKPDAVVLVATIRALKYHSGKFTVIPGKPLSPKMIKEDPESVRLGLPNLLKQISNALSFGIPVVVALNKFSTDHASEIELVLQAARQAGAEEAVVSNVWEDGAVGGIELAKAVHEAVKQPSNFKFTYKVDKPIKYKIKQIATTIYGAKDVVYTSEAKKQIATIIKVGLSHLPICMAKTHLSLSDDAQKLGAPKDFVIKVREIRLAAGAKFIYPILGKVRTMPGLPSSPALENIDIDKDGKIVGLF